MNSAEFVDLTTSPDELAKRPAKRQRLPEADAIDLEAEHEEEARHRIMRHACQVNQGRGISFQAPAKAQPQALGAAAAAGRQVGAGGSGTMAAAGHGAPSKQTAAASVAPAVAAAPAVGNRLLAELHAERQARQAQRQAQQHPPSSSSGLDAVLAAQRQKQPSSGSQRIVQPSHLRQLEGQQGGQELRLLTWNVWFREDVHLVQRMAAIGAVIQARHPHFVCLQEVTSVVYRLFSSSPWWSSYRASPCPPDAPYFTLLLSHSTVQNVGVCQELPFGNSVMGRDLKTVSGAVGGWPVRVATTHLESPVAWNQLYSQQRVAQCKQSVALLDHAPEGDVLLAGDMNWGPDDGTPPLPGGWSDAWLHLHSSDPGLTYDPKANPMLKPGNRIRRRLDRVWVKLQRWCLQRMDMVGREALLGLQFEGRPVLPSDHFGLLLVLRPRE